MIEIQSDKIDLEDLENRVNHIVNEYEKIDKETLFKEEILKNEHSIKSKVNIHNTSKYKILKKVQNTLLKYKLGFIEEVGKKIYKKIFSSSPNAYIIEEFLSYEDKSFIKIAFKTILQREVQENELQEYLALLRNGILSKTEILVQLRFSPEGEKIKLNILGLGKRYLIFKLFKIPLLGKVFKTSFLILKLPNLLTRIQLLESEKYLLSKELSDKTIQINSLISDNKVYIEKLNTTLENTNTTLENTNINLRNEISIVSQKNTTLNNNIQNYQDDLVLTRRFITNTQSSLKDLINNSASALENTSDEIKAKQKDILDSKLLESFYIAFENRFRGSRKDIKQRQSYYLPYINEIIKSNEDEVLDVGCGRGEWLELLKENDIKAKGVDLNSLMIDETLSLDLDAKVQDAIIYLKELKDESLSVVSGFHIVEHLPFEILVELLDQSLRVLKEGGMIIFETPNPENIFVGSCSFYTDPTHINPIPPNTLQFLAQNRGFKNVEIHRLHPVKSPIYPNVENADDLNTLIFSSTKEQDYSIIGYK